jgi:hypothetical protein
MLIIYCTHCAFHEAKEEEGNKKSYCSKENCWSQFSKCLSKHALNRFLEQEKLEIDRNKRVIA